MTALPPPVRLVTIGFSHYCEKARWALERAHIAFSEDRHPPGLHYWAVRRAGGHRFTPLLVTADGPMEESTDILRWCDAHGDAEPLFAPGPDAAEIDALEDRFDAVLGPATRRVVYHYGLPHPWVMMRTALAGVPWHDKLIFPFVAPAAVLMVRRITRSDRATTMRSIDEIRTIFDEVDARLADGRRYLVGDRFTAADLTLAALAAPVIWPDGYGAWLPPLDALPAGIRAVVDEHADRPAAHFVRRMYAEHRSR